jgi:hypothetical protein
LFSKKKVNEIKDSMTLSDLLHEAKVTDDPVFAYACLKRAEIMAPDSLDVQRALLMHGRLHERGRVAGDYRVIKCYLLHCFEHPEKHSEQEQEQMAREIFDSPHLKNCLALSPQPEAFMKDYLTELCAEYMHIFIAGDTSHAPAIFGLATKGMLHRYLAKPSNDLLRNVLSSPWLSEEEQLLLARSFYQAFHRQMEGQTKELDKLLGAEICRTLA